MTAAVFWVSKVELEEITEETAEKNIERAVEFFDAVKDYLATRDKVRFSLRCPYTS